MLWPKEVSGSHTLIAEVDPGEVIDESNEDNNNKTISVTPVVRNIQGFQLIQMLINRLDFRLQQIVAMFIRQI